MESKIQLEQIKNKVYSSKKKENEIYVSRKRKNIEKFYYKRAEELLICKNFKEIFICGLGACLNHAVKISLIVVDCIPNTKIEEIDTKTISHLDEFKNLDTGEIEVRQEERMSNFIKIKITKKI
jgi:hypothetical protein